MQSLKREQPLCLTVPPVRVDQVSSRASGQHDDGEGSPRPSSRSAVASLLPPAATVVAQG